MPKDYHTMQVENKRSWSGPRALLTKQQATEIYMIGKLVRRMGIDPMLGSRSAQIAKTYGVSPKAIRDIWNRRTWQNETRHLWDKHEQPVIRYRRPVLLSNHCELLSASWESCGTDRSLARSEELAAQSLSTSERTEPWLTRCVTGSTICAYSCDEQEIDLQRVGNGAPASFTLPPSAANLPPPKIPQYSQGAVAQGDCFQAAAAEWEGPFGPCLPPASECDADPFHADWPYW